jgi:hypothetical protein
MYWKSDIPFCNRYCTVLWKEFCAASWRAVFPRLLHVFMKHCPSHLSIKYLENAAYNIMLKVLLFKIFQIIHKVNSKYRFSYWSDHHNSGLPVKSHTQHVANLLLFKQYNTQIHNILTPNIKMYKSWMPSAVISLTTSGWLMARKGSHSSTLYPLWKCFTHVLFCAAELFCFQPLKGLKENKNAFNALRSPSLFPTRTRGNVFFSHHLNHKPLSQFSYFNVVPEEIIIMECQQ